MLGDQIISRAQTEGVADLRRRFTRTGFQAAAHARAKTMSLADLEELCDDPARDLPGGVNVRAILTLDPENGFYLSAQDGEELYEITDARGKRVRYRTIEIALGVLQNVSGLSPDIGLLQASPRRKRH